MNEAATSTTKRNQHAACASHADARNRLERMRATETKNGSHTNSISFSSSHQSHQRIIKYQILKDVLMQALH